MLLKPKSEDGEFRVVIRRGNDEIIIETFNNEADAQDYFDKCTAEDSFLFEIGGDVEYTVSFEVPETIWKSIAKRMVLTGE